MYRTLCARTFFPTSLTMVTTGTLIILITGLFINGGAGGQLNETGERTSPNMIVMNTVISSATSGLTLMIMNQWNNIQHVEAMIQQTGLVETYNIQQLCNAIIAGFVSISASCDSVFLWQSTLIGLVGCLIYS